MSHTAVFPLLTVDRNKFRLSLFVCICEFKTGIMTFSHVYTFFRGTHSIFDFSVAPVVRVKMWGSFTVTAEGELWHGPLCSLCLLSWPSCFEVWMAVVMNAPLFIRTLTVEEGGWLCSWQCFLLSLCVQIQIQETHTKGPEPLNPVLWLTQTLFVDLNFPTALDTVVKSFISASGAAVKKPFVIVSSVVFCKNTLNFILIIFTRLDWFQPCNRFHGVFTLTACNVIFETSQGAQPDTEGCLMDICELNHSQPLLMLLSKCLKLRDDTDKGKTVIW